MATLYDYTWYIDGRYLAILQNGSSTSYDPDSISMVDMFVTPENDQDAAIMLEYVYSPTNPTAETDTISVNNLLSLAIVDYVKFRMAEDAGNEKLARSFYGKFLSRVSRETDNRTGMPRKAIPTGAGVLK